jgi:hypothetical protein
MADGDGLSHGLMAALATPLFGFSGLTLVHLFRHGNRLEAALNAKDKALTDKMAELTEALIRVATLEAELRIRDERIATLTNASHPAGEECGSCELRHLARCEEEEE